jgi:hypothetical protein
VQETDLAVLNQTSNNVSILLPSVDNNASHASRKKTSSPIPVGTNRGDRRGDLDSDEFRSCAVVNQGDNSISILMGSSQSDADIYHRRWARRTDSHDAGRYRDRQFYSVANVPSLAVTNKAREHVGIYIGSGRGLFPIAWKLTRQPVLRRSPPPFSRRADCRTWRAAMGDTLSQGVVTIIQDSSSFANGATPTQNALSRRGIHRSGA